MTASNYLYLLGMILVLMAWSARLHGAESGTAAVSPTVSSTSATSTVQPTAKGQTSRKSSHRKKKNAVADQTATKTHSKKRTKNSRTAGSTLNPEKVPGGMGTASGASGLDGPIVPPTASSQPITVTRSTRDSQTQITISAPVSSTERGGSSAGPVVETGLPIARRGAGTTYTDSFPSEGGIGSRAGESYQVASAFPPVIPITSTLGSYTPRHRVKNPLDNFTFTNFPRRQTTTYPWKIDIMTTKFWIGEGSTPISSTTNEASAWDQDWRANNGGTDSPDDRDGYLPGRHIATINPFYVALPFNDLAFPDKARRWVPASWYRPPKDGRQVSACQHRWVEIKNAQGDYCFAQWEDVGPLRYDHAEYVFGHDAPDTYTSGGLDHAGLDVSPAVADYLNITGKNCITRWRFVDDADVQPGIWLKYDEQALLFKAIKNGPSRQLLPIDAARAPIDDASDIDSNKKKIGAAKG